MSLPADLDFSSSEHRRDRYLERACLPDSPRAGLISRSIKTKRESPDRKYLLGLLSFGSNLETRLLPAQARGKLAAIGTQTIPSQALLFKLDNSGSNVVPHSAASFPCLSTLSSPLP